LSSKKGDIMLTPFAGAGSECVAAKETGREYIGYETDPVYVEIANTRLEHAIEEKDAHERPVKKEITSDVNEDPNKTKKRGKAKAETHGKSEAGVKAAPTPPVEYEQLTFSLDT